MLEAGQAQIVLRCVKYDLESGGFQIAAYVSRIYTDYEVPENFK